MATALNKSKDGALQEVLIGSQSSLRRMMPQIVKGLIFLTVVYTGCLVFLNNSSLAIPDPQYCPESNPSCKRPDLFGFQMASFAALWFCGILGVGCWHFNKRAHTVIPNTPEGRIFGYLPEGEQLAAGSFAFQAWTLAASFLIAEHCTAIMIMHHSIAAFVSWSSLECQYLHYYGVFFLGLSEFSSIFLIFIGLARFFPPSSPSSIFGAIVFICRPCFAVSFTYYRVVLWWKVSYQLWRDAIYIMKKGLHNKLRPGKGYVLHLFLAMNIPMGLLQLYWFSLILKEVVKVIVRVLSAILT